MALIRICERFTEDTSSTKSFDATVSIDDGRTSSIRICDPFSDEEIQLLEWYFEEYPRFPFVQQIEARRAAASITTYGEALFTQVFADPESRRAYKECIQAEPDTLLRSFRTSWKLQGLSTSDTLDEPISPLMWESKLSCS